MNGQSKPGDYPLLSLRGRHYSRLSPKAVATFHIVNCEQCEAPITVQVLTISEPDDERLKNEGLHPFQGNPPPDGTSMHEYAGYFCPTCYDKWLEPLEASHE